MPQAESLKTILGDSVEQPLDLAIWLDVSEQTVRDRIAEPACNVGAVVSRPA